MRQDSYIMKTLSVLAIIFLPISTVSSVFGTPFFTQTTLPNATSSSSVEMSFVVSGKFWLLWTISIPLTLALLGGWVVCLKRSKLSGKTQTNWVEDVEKSKSV